MNYEDSLVAHLPATLLLEAAVAVKQVAAMSVAAQAMPQVAVPEQTVRALRVQGQQARAQLARGPLGRVPAQADRRHNRQVAKAAIRPTDKTQETQLALADLLRVDQAAEAQVVRRQVVVNSPWIR